MDEASQFSDFDDQVLSSPAHKATIQQNMSESIKLSDNIKQPSTRDQTLEFLKMESEYSAQIHDIGSASIDANKVH